MDNEEIVINLMNSSAVRKAKMILATEIKCIVRKSSHNVSIDKISDSTIMEIINTVFSHYNVQATDYKDEEEIKISYKKGSINKVMAAKALHNTTGLNLIKAIEKIKSWDLL